MAGCLRLRTAKGYLANWRQSSKAHEPSPQLYGSASGALFPPHPRTHISHRLSRVKELPRHQTYALSKICFYPSISELRDGCVVCQPGQLVVTRSGTRPLYWASDVPSAAGGTNGRFRAMTEASRTAALRSKPGGCSTLRTPSRRDINLGRRPQLYSAACRLVPGLRSSSSFRSWPV